VVVGEHVSSRAGSHGDEAGAGRHFAVEVQFGITATVTIGR
jgi:hypothetical protein